MIIRNTLNSPVLITDIFSTPITDGLVVAPLATVVVFNAAANASTSLQALLAAGVLVNEGSEEPAQGTQIEVSGVAGPPGPPAGPQPANSVLAGPASGPDDDPAFRALVSADIPNNAANSTGNAGTATSLAGGTTGEVPYQVSPGVSAFVSPGSSGQVLTSNGVAAPTYQNPSSVPVQTRQIFLSGSGNYITPANVRQLMVTIIAGGGGSGGTTGNGGTGVSSSFGTINAVGGGGSLAINNPASAGGSGGSGGTGGDGQTVRLPGSDGQHGETGAGYANGGDGGSSPLGGMGYWSNSANSPTAGKANSGSGAGGGASGATAASGGGGSGEYVNALISSPASTYSYAVGAGGAAGSGVESAAGGSGLIIVTEYY